MSPHRRGPPRSPPFAPFGGAPVRSLRPRRLLSCRSRGARARARFGRQHVTALASDPPPASRSAWYPASLLARLDRTAGAATAVPGALATSRPSERPRSRAVRPALAPHDVSLVREPGELGHLPSHLAVRHLPPSPRGVGCSVEAREVSLTRRLSMRSRDPDVLEDDASGRSSVLRWIHRVRVGRDPAATPVHSTDVCCSRIQFSEMILRASTHAASHSPRDTGARGSRRATHFGDPTDVPGECSSPSAVMPACL